MAKVIIAEKPSVAKNIADAFKIKTRKDGYFEGNGYYITWAFGHLLQLYDAKDYDESMKDGDLKNSLLFQRTSYIKLNVIVQIEVLKIKVQRNSLE